MKIAYLIMFCCCLASCVSNNEKKNIGEENKISPVSNTKLTKLDTLAHVNSTASNILNTQQKPEQKPEQKPVQNPVQNPDVISMLTHVVIAKSGLFLRESPDRKGKVLTKIPYFSNIEILSTKSFRAEKVLIESKRVPSHMDIEFEANWVKVKYNKLEGYVHNSYIMRKYNRKKKVLKYDYDFAFPGFSCDFNFHPNPNLKWYGIYKRKDDFERVPITLEYQIWNRNNMTPILTLVEPSDSLVFCFASGNNLTRGSVVGTMKYANLEFDMDNYDLSLKELGISYKAIEGKDGNNYILQKDGLHQLLNEEQIESEYNSITAFDWVGDLDEDGILDYVITYGTKGGRTILYLSSEAKGNEIVAPVAIYLRSYCC